MCLQPPCSHPPSSLSSACRGEEEAEQHLSQAAPVPLLAGLPGGSPPLCAALVGQKWGSPSCSQLPAACPEAFIPARLQFLCQAPPVQQHRCYLSAIPFLLRDGALPTQVFGLLSPQMRSGSQCCCTPRLPFLSWQALLPHAFDPSSSSHPPCLQVCESPEPQLFALELTAGARGPLPQSVLRLVWLFPAKALSFLPLRYEAGAGQCEQMRPLCVLQV